METRPGGLRTRKTCFSFPIIGFRVTDSVASKVKDESMTSSLAGQRNLERREMKLRRQIRPSAAIDNNGTQRALYAEKNGRASRLHPFRLRPRRLSLFRPPRKGSLIDELTGRWSEATSRRELENGDDDDDISRVKSDRVISAGVPHWNRGPRDGFLTRPTTSSALSWSALVQRAARGGDFWMQEPRNQSTPGDRVNTHTAARSLHWEVNRK